MKPHETEPRVTDAGQTETSRGGKTKVVFNSDIANCLDLMVEYLVDKKIKGIQPLILGEVEKRLIIKVLERSRGNKLQAAKLLGMSRNTFHRKIQKLVAARVLVDTKSEV